MLDRSELNFLLIYHLSTCLPVTTRQTSTTWWFCQNWLVLELPEFIDYKILTLTHLFYSGCIFTVLRAEALGSSLLARLLSVPKVLGSNPGISGWKEEILGYVFVLKRAHRAETDFTNIEWFPHRLLTGVTTPLLSEEDPIRAPPASTSQPSLIISVKDPCDTNCPIKIVFDIMFFLDNFIQT